MIKGFDCSCFFSAIANNIVHAVESSHQTLLILSKNYVRSGWARYEYQVAQEEMLNRHHRIIPVFLDDPADIPIEDRNLQHMLKSVTYIIWPKKGSAKKLEAFWESLRKSILNPIHDAKTKTQRETRL